MQRFAICSSLLTMYLSQMCLAFTAAPQISSHHHTCTGTTGTPNRVGSSSSLYAHQNANANANNRRTFLNQLALPLAVAGISSTLSPKIAQATLMSTDMEEVKTFKAGEKLTIEEAKNRFKLAIEDVDELIANYPEISKGGGDNVRRYLGTVGAKSHMYGITKVLKGLREEADDVIEFTEASNEFEAYLFQAEGAAYQSLFVEHSSAKGTPETLLATAKKDVLSMRKLMSDLATQLNM